MRSPRVRRSLPKGFVTLYNFKGTPDGSGPSAGVIIDAAGDIFGTTTYGGSGGTGTIFELVPSGSSYKESILRSFLTGDGNGYDPISTPYEDANGNLFVTPLGGGKYDGGSVVELSPAGTMYQQTGLYSFQSRFGAYPFAAISKQGSTLYATASSGGANGVGSILALTSSGLVGSDVYDFKGDADGATPESNLVADDTGALYGTTFYGGGADRCGTLYKFEPSAGGGTESIVYAFQGFSDGCAPSDGVVFDKAGNIYGTTSEGALNYGTIFKVQRHGSGYTESSLHSFAGGTDGATPRAGLTLRGNFLYGTTTLGGSGGDGTLFRISTSGTGYKVLFAFQGQTGISPLGALVSNYKALYGTTAGGGTAGYGTVFRFLP